MQVSSMIKLGIATALLLLPRRSSSQADKVPKLHKLKHPSQDATHKHDHNTYLTNDDK